MVNLNVWPIIRLLQRLSVFITVAGCAYVVFFLFSNKKDSFTAENGDVASKQNIGLISSSPRFDLKPNDASAEAQARDIFSLGPPVGPSSAEDNTPKGQLPDHLKVVGILISEPSQIIIEDKSLNKTYFINEGNPQDGIKIVRVDKNQMIINYHGQDISVPINISGD